MPSILSSRRVDQVGFSRRPYINPKILETTIKKSKKMTPKWKNRTLFHGDNLKFLRAMNSESVDLIAIDPPYSDLVQ